MEKEDKLEVEQGFYQKCAELLGVPDTYKARPYSRRTRWNNRGPGNGRFEGCGLIRLFSSNCIHVALVNPIKVNRWFKSPEEVIEFLEASL